MFSISSGFPKNDLIIEYPASSPHRKNVSTQVPYFPKLCQTVYPFRQARKMFITLWPHYHKKHCCGFPQEAVFVYI